ncbi:MAG: hypothetical protein EON58_18220 [Alphaproteobacteria bacterium]|nr:MAG: hypothetical protein EON58_18220 [Alphaproteobacteria bacterium]
MHPSEMKNAALAAAAKAEQDGFRATARAFLHLADVCEEEATQLAKPVGWDRHSFEQKSTPGGMTLSLLSH